MFVKFKASLLIIWCFSWAVLFFILVFPDTPDKEIYEILLAGSISLTIYFASVLNQLRALDITREEAQAHQLKNEADHKQLTILLKYDIDMKREILYKLKRGIGPQGSNP